MDEYGEKIAQEVWDRWERETLRLGISAIDLIALSEDFLITLREESSMRVQSYKESVHED